MKPIYKVRFKGYSAIAFLLLSALLFLPTLPQTQAIPSNGPIIKKFVFGDVVVETVIRGSGETIVLLPGRGLSADSFAELARLLDKSGYRAVAINPRGIEGSTGPLEKLTLKDYADDVAAVIKALGAPRVHVLGHAYGNRVARALAVDHPELVQTVILLAAGGRVGPRPEAVKAAEKLESPDATRNEKIEATRVVYFGPKSDPMPWVDLKAYTAASKAQGEALRASPRDSWWSGGKAPMLVIQGLEDKIAPPENGRALRDEYADRVTLIELPDVGHALVIEQPKEIAKAIHEFLKSRRATHGAAAAR
ncbi:MAG TPA: alpha/beta hydrolase [Pyrinomonadaceae bacterium]|nr:alpha/beta hydrolase [Pyrinomonadaceae bacterium]